MPDKVHDPNTGVMDRGGRLLYPSGPIRVQGLNTTVSVSNSVGGTKLPSSPMSDRLFCRILNMGGEAIYIGWDTSVTTSNGWEILPHSSEAFNIEGGIDIYGICATGPVTCIVMEGK